MKYYVTPSVEVIEMTYREPVCLDVSGGNVPDYEVIDPGEGFFNAPGF